MNAKKWAMIGLATTMLSSVNVVAQASSDNEWDRTEPTGAAHLTDPQVLNLPDTEHLHELDTSTMEHHNAFTISGQVFEGLTRLDKNGKAIPGVAKYWKIFPDGKSYVFILRDDARWSDGTKVTAHDFEYAWKRTLDPATGSMYAFMAAWIKGGTAYNKGTGSANDVAVKAVDDRVLMVTLEHPVPFFPEQMSFPIFYPQKQSFVEQLGVKGAYGTSTSTVLSNGAFQVSEWDDGHVKLVKNDKYWDRRNVKLDEVTVKTVSGGADTKEAMYLAGELDYFSLTGSQIDKYKDSPEKMVQPSLSTGYFMFNVHNPTLQNANIRKALTYAIDGDKYADLVYHDGSKNASGLVPTGISNGNGGDFRADGGDVVNRAANMALAKEYLAQGLQELGLSSLPPLTILGYDNPRGKQAYGYLQSEWSKHLGVNINVEYLTHHQMDQRMADGQFDFVISVWGADYNDPMTFLDLWTTGASYNFGSYGNAKYDELIQEAKAETNAATRIQELHDAEKILLDDMGVGPLYFSAKTFLIKPYVHDFLFHTSSPGFDLKTTYIQGKQ